MGKLESTIPGLGYPSGREDPLKTGQGYLDGRKRDDGAEGLWRIKDGLYDLETFANSHPGGAEWINITKGTDITEAFEVHHLTDKPGKLLPKFFVRKVVSPRLIPFTFLPHGFYIKFKERAKIALKDVDFHSPATRTNLIADSLSVATLASSLIAAYTNFWIAFIISGHKHTEEDNQDVMVNERSLSQPSEETPESQAEQVSAKDRITKTLGLDRIGTYKEVKYVPQLNDTWSEWMIKGLPERINKTY